MRHNITCVCTGRVLLLPLHELHQQQRVLGRGDRLRSLHQCGHRDCGHVRHLTRNKVELLMRWQVRAGRCPPRPAPPRPPSPGSRARTSPAGSPGTRSEGPGSRVLAGAGIHIHTVATCQSRMGLSHSTMGDCHWMK